MILADRLPNAVLEVIELAGHNPQDENPGAVIEAIEEFLTREHAPVEAEHDFVRGGTDR